VSLELPHRKFPRSVLWRVTDAGVALEGDDHVFRTRGRPVTARRIWNDFRHELEAVSRGYQVPVALLVATAATETRGNPGAVRHEPGYAVELVSGIPPGAGIGWLDAHHHELPLDAFVAADDATPHRVSPGLMQTLISTARVVLGEPSLGRAELLNPEVSIAAAAAYMRLQADWPPDRSTFLDPVLVAAAYNAGGLIQESSTDNPWRLRSHPRRTGAHISRFVRWYGDARAVVR
jgi:hypothetical protein